MSDMLNIKKTDVTDEKRFYNGYCG